MVNTEQHQQFQQFNIFPSHDTFIIQTTRLYKKSSSYSEKIKTPNHTNNFPSHTFILILRQEQQNKITIAVYDSSSSLEKIHNIIYRTIILQNPFLTSGSRRNNSIEKYIIFEMSPIK